MLSRDPLLGGVARVGCRLQLMSRFHVFYSAMPEMGSGFKPVEAADAYSEAPQLFDQPASQSPASLQWNLILGVAAANQ